jgi:hypothetical protein
LNLRPPGPEPSNAPAAMMPRTNTSRNTSSAMFQMNPAIRLSCPFSIHPPPSRIVGTQFRMRVRLLAWAGPSHHRGSKAFAALGRAHRHALARYHTSRSRSAKPPSTGSNGRVSPSSTGNSVPRERGRVPDVSGRYGKSEAINKCPVSSTTNLVTSTSGTNGAVRPRRLDHRRDHHLRYLVFSGSGDHLIVK